MNNPGLIKKFYSGAAIAAYRIIKFGADDDHVVQSSAAGDLHIGASMELGADAAEDSIDIALSGAVEVEYGAAVTRGQKLTADANGRAVPAATTNQVIGVAMVSGVLGDIGSMFIAPSTLP